MKQHNFGMRDCFSNRKTLSYTITILDDNKNQIILHLQRIYVSVTYSGP